MPKPRRRLILPVEIFNREFDAKVLLACFAAERGFSVIVGSKREIHLKMDLLPQSIYLAINLSDRNIVIDTLLNKLGHRIAGGDEESIVYSSPEVYIKEKLGSEVFKKPEIFLAWGPENQRIWETHSNYQGAPIHITGNPRIDLLRPELRPFWELQTQDLLNRYGRFILINTNYDRINNHRPGKGEDQQILKAARADPSAVSEYDLALATYHRDLFQNFQAMASTIAHSYPDYTIVIRPHPSESKETWEEATAACSNVQVVFEGNIVPWLLAAQVVIHNSCTTGLESYILGVPVIAYRPLTSDRFDRKLPNSLSQQAFNLPELQTLMDVSLKGCYQPDPSTSTTQKNLIQQYIAYLEGSFASEKTVDILEEYDNTLTDKPATDLPTYLTGKTEAVWRRIKRQYNASFHMNKNNRQERYQYLTHIFPDIELGDVTSRIENFQSILNRFNGLATRRITKGIFEITATRS
jgi:surface carbohydrate biosynthesis protein